MSSSPESWLRRLLSAFTTSAQLLAPRSAVCLLCGKPQQAARSAAGQNHSKLPPQLRQSVCGACLSAIPWISRIQCSKCGRGIHCDDCARHPHPSFICNRSAVQYDPMMRGVLAQYKYRGNEALAPLLGDMLVPAFEALSAEIASLYRTKTDIRSAKKQTFSDQWDAITYVPISEERAMDRGFNQAEQLAARLANRYGLPLMRLLVRDRHTEKQSFKTRSERLRDTRQLFNVNPADLHELQNRTMVQSSSIRTISQAPRVLLIDDIYTTGSTAEACSHTLHKHATVPLDIYVLTWSRS
ncbi:ComF family protein [Paenibacillus alkaliterrae]|uniref:ComF family protein n=1 Tax=Paenibacillus alkaliterrae TaxID=320909 RepID=UPI001F479F80|nr:ComF family protein [Paenibacillus alkaliterrae]MCF2941378.1 ComF family protein [Paenibacillus alkaliterrae]